MIKMATINWKSEYETFNLHQETIYEYIKKADSLMNQRSYQEAIALYEEAMKCIDKAQHIIFCPAKCPNALYEKVAESRKALKKTRKETINKIEECKNKLLERKASAEVSGKIVSGAAFVSSYLVGGAQKMEQIVTETTSLYVCKSGTNTSQAVISPQYQTGIKMAKDVTEKAVVATGFVASTVASLGLIAGSFIAPYAIHGATALVSVSQDINTSQAALQVDNFVNITGGILSGIGTIFGACSETASILGSTVANSATRVAKYKYGENVGTAVEDTFCTVGNAIQISNNVRICKPKNVIKSVVKNTVVEKSNINGNN